MVLPEITTGAIVKLAFDKFLETSAGELAKKYTQDAIVKMDQLRGEIWNQLRGNPKAEKAIQEIEGGSDTNLDRLKVYLEDSMEDDEVFTAKILALAKEINAGKLQDNSNLEINVHDFGTGIKGETNSGDAYTAGVMHIHPKDS